MIHPAIEAWRRIEPTSDDTITVEAIQEEDLRSVYRLLGVGKSNSNIIAKRSLHTDALIEQAIYDKVLSHMPLPAIKLYGFLNETNSRFAWLFLEDAGIDEYSPKRLEHRILAGEWLGHMHSLAPDLLKSTEFMRARGPDYFRKHLVAAPSIILNNLSNPMLSHDDKSILKEIVSQCKIIEKHWKDIEIFCDGMPQTLVHGDFKEDNILIYSKTIGESLIVIDWSKGGWGVPALDLAKFLGYSVEPDITAYESIIQEQWSFMNLDTIYRIGYVGEIFRCVTSIRWQSERLKYKWTETPMATLRIFKGWMDEIIDAAAWKDSLELDKRRRLFKRRTWH